MADSLKLKTRQILSAKIGSGVLRYICFVVQRHFSSYKHYRRYTNSSIIIKNFSTEIEHMNNLLHIVFSQKLKIFFNFFKTLKSSLIIS